MIEIPRVARRRETPGLGGYRGAKLRHVGPAQREEAGRPELFRQVGRYRDWHVAQRPQPERRRLARDRTAQVLEQDGDATERAIGQVALSLQPRRVEPGPDHGVQLRIDRLNSGDSRRGQFLRAYLAAPDKVCLCGGVQPGCLIHPANATRAPSGAIPFSIGTGVKSRVPPRPAADGGSRSLLVAAWCSAESGGVALGPVGE
jgi:hypothetical protein